MAYTYHPFPLIRAIKSVFAAMLFMLVLFLLREWLSQFLIPLAMVMAAFCLLGVASAFAVASTYSITLEDSTITYRYGVFTRMQYTISYSKITETRYSRTLAEQMLGFGTLTIDTAGFTDIPVNIRDVRISDIEKTIETINSRNAANP